MTEYLLGKRERISWVEETSYATGGDMAADGEVIGVNATFTPNFSQSWQEILTAGADDRNVQDRVLGPKDVKFTLDFNPVDFKFLRYLLDYTNVDNTTYYSHVLTLANTQNSFKLERAMRHSGTDHVLTLTGCVVLSATISFAKATGEGMDGHISVRLECLAQDVSAGSSVTSLSAGNITDDPFQYRHCKVTLDNTEVTEVNNGELTIDSGIEPADSRYCNDTLNRTIGEPIPKVFRLTGRFNINISDSTYFDDWDGGAVVSNCSLDFTEATHNKLELDFSNFRVVDGTSATALEGVNNVDLTFNTEGISTATVEDSGAW